MRQELRDGQWVELREHISHADDKEIRRAQIRSRQDPENHAGDGDTVALRVFIKAWNINDINGEPLALTDADAIERMPSDIVDLIAPKINAIYHPQATVPNAPTPPSSDA